MPALRSRLKRPETYLLVLAFGCLAALADVNRAPQQQVLARGYVGLVRGYQTFGRPLLAGRVVCRFVPSCSEYSQEAVRRHGLVHGLVLTLARVRSCTRAVPLGTPDPVPAARRSD